MSKPSRKGGRVYVATDGKIVKVGMSTRGKCKSRFSELRVQFGFIVAEAVITDRRYDYNRIETEVKHRLASVRITGEFFSCSYQHAIATLNQVMSEFDYEYDYGGVGSANVKRDRKDEESKSGYWPLQESYDFKKGKPIY